MSNYPRLASLAPDMTSSNQNSGNSGFQLKNISEQPLLYTQNKRDDKNYLKRNDDANLMMQTTSASPEGTSGTNGGDDNNPNKTPTEIVPMDENNGQPPNNNKRGIFTSFLGGSDDDTLTAFNLYRNKKLLTQSMMDIALFSANANQLRNVLQANDGHIISSICIVLLLMSILLQILVGVCLILSIQYNVTNCEQRKKAFEYGNYVIVGIFLITVVNVLISAFGGPQGTGN